MERRHVHAQRTTETASKSPGRRDKCRPDQANRLRVYLLTARGFFCGTISALTANSNRSVAWVDLGWYLHPVCTMGCELEKADADSRDGFLNQPPRGPIAQILFLRQFCGDFLLPDDISVSFHCSFLASLQQMVNVSGTKGFVQFQDFTNPFYGSEASFYVSNNVVREIGCDTNREEHTRRIAVPEYSSGVANAQDVSMIRNILRFGTVGKARRLLGKDDTSDSAGPRCLHGIRSQ